ncbi:hypothetical protein [Nitratidesulfovibrio sp. 1201_IL3209]|uniref:hypothetical protein n=1 Tax=Nitratidesulfovibrio sp. 1201_IL3209 TaxID=3084053 RepID=UPI002FD89C4A
MSTTTRHAARVRAVPCQAGRTSQASRAGSAARTGGFRRAVLTARAAGQPDGHVTERTTGSRHAV